MRRTNEHASAEAGAGRAAVLRIILAGALLLGGAVLAAYGAVLNRKAVVVERQVQPPPRVEFQWPPVFPQPPLVERVLVLQSEPQLIREVSVGGLTRTAEGELQRTYSGDSPARCPT